MSTDQISIEEANKNHQASTRRLTNWQLAAVIQVYNDAFDKARAGRKFANPCQSGTDEFMAWEMGTMHGDEARQECAEAG